jgi:hypothetical protein
MRIIRKIGKIISDYYWLIVLLILIGLFSPQYLPYIWQINLLILLVVLTINNSIYEKRIKYKILLKHQEWFLKNNFIMPINVKIGDNMFAFEECLGFKVCEKWNFKTNFEMIGHRDDIITMQLFSKEIGGFMTINYKRKNDK